ncbi:PREDICTED: odorant receptor 67a-like isoform X2 [Vollenhovia emeryi]|uniref:odorant receptor 67a-like isoform X2 n=1 Tax=Vollenhovia emeryi TaxID=411798 RepID=UPI0005F3EECA|nr:PREDICTED: odorant receptor 67a-like isoform X2 [Vollenhovia emeryi]
MDSVDKFFGESHYNIVRVLLGVNGLWPYHTTGRRCGIYFALLLVLGSGMTFEVLGIIEVWPDSLEVIDCLPMLVLGTVSITKLVCAIHTLPEIRILLIKMRQYWCSPKSDEETKILHSYALYGRNLSYAYAGIILSHTVVFVFTTLLSKLLHVESNEDDSSSSAHDAQVGLPYHVNYMVDPQTYYVPIFVHVAICVVSYTVLMLTFDVLYMTLIQHCCGLFAALRYRMENAFEFDGEGDNLSMAARGKLYSNIVYSIRRHADAIQFAIVTESIHRIPLFIHVGANISVLSILGFQVIMNTEDVNHLLKYASYLSALLLNTFFENWQGQKMIDSSEKVYESAYNAEWYKMPTAQRKLFMMVMMRSRKPLTITAGNFVNLSYVNFNAEMLLTGKYICSDLTE